MSLAPSPLPVGRLGAAWVVAGVGAVALALALGLGLGPVGLHPGRVLLEVLDHLPGVDVDSGLGERQAAIVWNLRLPRVVLALLVGATLALAGGAYQGVFRNPLADPYLLGAAAGAGLGATIAIVNGLQAERGWFDVVPLAAFVGALAAASLTYVLGASDRLRSTASLILAGVAVSSFLTAVQTYLQQRNAETIRDVYAWILGGLATSGWHEVLLVLPYVVVSSVVLLAHRRSLDVLGLGDEEAAALGLHPGRIRLVVVVAASLATAAVVAVSGLIGFVGIIVPHTVRLLAGSSHRIVLPLSIFFGAAFMALADLLARTLLAPGEIPIGVVTAFFGGPFFVVVLRTSRRVLA